MSTITLEHLQTSYPPILPLPFNANQPPTIRLYPLSNYTFSTKEDQLEEDRSVVARLKRLEEHYEQYGMRRTCEGVLVCHEHNHPHILMFQIANAFFKLPGDYLNLDEDEITGFKSRLNKGLAPVSAHYSKEGSGDNDWQIGDILAQWWRPNFETFMYPFIPAHITRPKECKKLYFVQLPKNMLSVPKNMKLLAVPLFELYDNTQRYGPQLSAIPHLLSRYNFEFVDEDGNVVAVTPGGGPGEDPLQARVLVGEDSKVLASDDEFAIESHARAQRAWRDGKFDEEVVPVTVKGRKGDTLVKEEEGYNLLKKEKVPTLKHTSSRMNIKKEEDDMR